MYDPNTPTVDANSRDSSTVFEGLSIRLAPAPIRKRIFAFLIDVSILTVIAYIYVFAAIFIGALLLGGTAGLMSSLRGSAGDLPMVLAIALVILFILGSLTIWHGYFCYYEHKNGTTPGKRVLGLRVVSLNQGKLTWGQVIFRDMFRYIDAWMILPGLIAMLMNDRKQRIGDMAANTMVVHSKEREQKEQFLYLSSEDYHALNETLQPRNMSKDLCDAFLRFAYPFFVTGRANYTRSEIEHWLARVKEHLGGNIDSMSPELVLRFFAEHCLQTLNSLKGGNNHG